MSPASRKSPSGCASPCDEQGGFACEISRRAGNCFGILKSWQALDSSRLWDGRVGLGNHLLRHLTSFPQHSFFAMRAASCRSLIASRRALPSHRRGFLFFSPTLPPYYFSLHISVPGVSALRTLQSLLSRRLERWGPGGILDRAALRRRPTLRARWTTARVRVVDALSRAGDWGFLRESSRSVRPAASPPISRCAERDARASQSPWHVYAKRVTGDSDPRGLESYSLQI